MSEKRAEHLIKRALSETLDGLDAIPTLDAAITQLRIEAGEAPADELDRWFCGCSDDDCPFDD